jgi:hypothetical protein
MKQSSTEEGKCQVLFLLALFRFTNRYGIRLLIFLVKQIPECSLSEPCGFLARYHTRHKTNLSNTLSGVFYSNASGPYLRLPLRQD